MADMSHAATLAALTDPLAARRRPSCCAQASEQLGRALEEVAELAAENRRLRDRAAEDADTIEQTWLVLNVFDPDGDGSREPLDERARRVLVDQVAPAE